MHNFNIVQSILLEAFTVIYGDIQPHKDIIHISHLSKQI